MCVAEISQALSRSLKDHAARSRLEGLDAVSDTLTRDDA